MLDLVKLNEVSNEAFRLCVEDKEKLIMDCTNLMYWLTSKVTRDNLSAQVKYYQEAILEHMWIDNYDLMKECGILDLDHYICDKEVDDLWGKYYIVVKRLV